MSLIKELQPIWLGCSIIFGVFLAIFTIMYISSITQYPLDCITIKNMLLQQSCNIWYSTVYNIFGILGSIVGSSLILYCIARIIKQPNQFYQYHDAIQSRHGVE